MPNIVENLPSAQRSTDPRDYQAVPRPMAAMAKAFADRAEIAPHSHHRDQLLFAVRGTMRVRTEAEAWIVPPYRAVYIPGGITHAMSIRGDLEMRTLYIARGTDPGLPALPIVLEVSDLLRSLILALIDEPVLYDQTGRGGAMATLILSEITGARRLPLGLTLPQDPRLARICAALIADPGTRLTLDAWADHAGASARTLARLFTRETGMSFGAWRRRVRLQSAVEQIVAGASVDRVAADCGYRSASAFAVAFRRSVGVAPTTLRRASDGGSAVYGRLGEATGASQPR
ncbi:MAG: helix-turn-helix transcriptional regulator [Paracoccaceae bacterium]|nr:helix-turn-helix transcriptional regulator [Paracoccaceae bacterium]